MAHFWDRSRAAAVRFLSGRNGTDQLGGALLVLYVALVLLRSALLVLFPYALLSALLSLPIVLLAVLIFFRVFSRNLPRRRRENERFLRWWGPRAAALSAAAERRRDRDHRYFRCPGCGAFCRVPRGAGKIRITCPRCRHVMERKS